MMNLDGYQSVQIDWDRLPLEDQWILSRLASVTQAVDQELDRFAYGEASRVLYDFAWDNFCSYYVEMAKPRLQDPNLRPQVQRILAHCLDHMLRLLHPMMPFVTEAIWQQLGKIVPHRDLLDSRPAERWLMRAPWPKAETRFLRAEVESQFSYFASLMGALREIRSRQNIPPRDRIQFSVRCQPEIEQLLRPMQPFFGSMAGAEALAWGPDFTIPSVHAHVAIESMDVYVDLSQLIDVAAEISRNEKLLANLVKQIQGKEGRLANEAFVSKAPPEIIEKERQALSELTNQRAATEQALERLRQMP
jgi:valyl-tRNA synthetase